jgi:hypothetical protein
VWKPAVSSAARDLHQLLTIEVKAVRAMLELD